MINIKEKSVCFALLARDCRIHLQDNIEEILSKGGAFNYFSIIVVENDSKDGTKEYLRELELSHTNVFILSKDTNEETMRKNDRPGSFFRIEKMAKFRNIYLDFFFNELKGNFDYMFVVDSDIEYFNLDNVIRTIENAPDDWSALFANGRYFLNIFGHRVYCRYYDLFAYLPEQKYLPNCEYNYQLTRKEMALYSDELTMHNLKKYRYFPCSSAFGGIGIYNMRKYSGELYSTEKRSRGTYFGAVCEHIKFNMSFLQNGQNYICSDMIVAYEELKSLRGVISVLFPAKMRIFFWEKIMHKQIG